MTVIRASAYVGPYIDPDRLDWALDVQPNV